MTQAAHDLWVPYSDYLLEEVKSQTKNEYINGVVYAMAGGTPEHAGLTAAVAGELRQILVGHPCRVYSSDLRIRIVETDMATYPDVTVICGQLKTAPDDPNATVNPTLLVEVLSDSTEAYDRGEKFAHYRYISSLKEYVLVSQRTQRVEVYRRNNTNHWELFEFRPGEAVVFESIGCKVDVNEIYRNPLVSDNQKGLVLNKSKLKSHGSY